MAKIEFLSSNCLVSLFIAIDLDSIIYQKKDKQFLRKAVVFSLLHSEHGPSRERSCSCGF